ncbi:MAG: sodium:solute symporter family protein, partial [Rickettsiaceae bacterium]|nr:sodium:solute symporter family protein [Rickettsiaceae bacterium]
MNFDIDIAIVVVFLMLNLGVGLYYGQGVKNIKEYALGGRNFTTGTLAATVIATWMGGDNFSLYLSETYKEGLFFILSSFGALAAFLIIAYIYAPRMKDFLGDLSVADAMGRLYGKQARIITAFVGFILIAAIVSIQFKIAATLMGSLLGVSAIYTTIASAVVVILYSSLGGIKSVTFTDVIQFFTFSAVIPVISLIVWSGIDDVDIVVDTLQNNPLFDIGLLLDYSTPKFWSFLTLMLLFIIPGFDPATFQRVSMSSDTKQLRQAFTYAAFAVLIIQLLISWISVLILSRESGLNADNLFSYILENYSYVGLKGIFVVGVLTMVMSTADSCLNSGAVMFAHDIAGTLKFVKYKQELSISRIAVVVIGITALFLALKLDDLFSLFIFGYSFYMPVVTVPMTLAVLGFRTSSTSALVGMSSGFFTAFVWIFLETEVDSVIPGLLANLFAMLGYHYITGQPGGWLPRPDTDNENTICRFKTKIASMQNFSLIDFCKKNLPQNESTYVLFSIFTIASIFSTNYPMSIEMSSSYQYLIYALCFSTFVITSYFLMYPMFPRVRCNQNILSLLWIGSVGYTLVFVAGVLVILSNFGPFQMVIFTLNMVVLSLLVRWQAALFLIVSCGISSVQFFKYYSSLLDLETDFSADQFKIIYVIVLVASVLVAFLKPKQEYLENTEERAVHLNNEVTNLNEQVGHFHEKISEKDKEIDRLGSTAQRILNNVNHELRLP